MTDQFGALALPVPVGGLAVRLRVLADFARAVLVSQVQTAFAGVAPLEPNEIAAAAYTEDPRKCVFSSAYHLPAVFAFEAKGTFAEGVGDGYGQSSSTISLWWLYPPADRERRRPFDSIAGDLARVLAAAIRDARHPAYVHEDDAAAPEAIRAAATAPAVDIVYDGADLAGTIGAGDWPTPGRVLLTKSAGAWDTASPVTVTVVLADGSEHAEEAYFTSATDAEAVECAWIGDRVVSVAVIGQVTTAKLAVGTALAPAAEHGSPLRDRMGVHRLFLASWERRDLAIETRPGAPAQGQKFDGVCFDVQIDETRDRTGEALGYEEIDASAAGRLRSVDGGVSAEVVTV